MKIRERVVGGRIGAWFAARDWAGFTVPWFGGALILYWAPKTGADGKPLWHVRAHEMVHAEQIKRLGRWGYVKAYLGELWALYRAARVGYTRRQSLAYAYEHHPMEREAYERTAR